MSSDLKGKRPGKSDRQAGDEQQAGDQQGERTMQAMTRTAYGQPELLALAEVPVPVPVGDQVLIRVQAAGVDQGVWHIVTGLPYPMRIAGFGLRRPKNPVPGMDLAGRVEAVGPNVTRFRPGDEVFGSCTGGSFAEFACEKQESLALKPVNLTFEQAAAVPISGFAALQGLRDSGKIQPGQKVLIIGAGGGVGTFAVQLAKIFGARVTGVCSTGKVDLVRSLGADDVIDYTRENFVDRPGRHDLILDIAGNRPLRDLRRVLTPDGTLVLAGAEVAGRWLGGTDRLIRALLLSPFVKHNLRPLMSSGRQEDLQFLSDLLASGKLTPVVAATYPLAQAAEAITALRAGRAAGKLVLATPPPR